MLPQAANKEVLAAYGRFYSLLLQSGADSWEEYLMDQVWGKCAARKSGLGGEGWGRVDEGPACSTGLRLLTAAAIGRKILERLTGETGMPKCGCGAWV